MNENIVEIRCQLLQHRANTKAKMNDQNRIIIIMSSLLL